MSDEPQYKVELVDITSLTFDPANPNEGSAYGDGLLEDSIQKLKPARSIVLDKDGHVVAGNGTLEQYGAIGGEKVLVIKTSGEYLVAVQREDFDLDSPDDTRAREYSIVDNRVGEARLTWSRVPMQRAMMQGVNLEKWFSRQDLQKLGLLPDVTPDETTLSRSSIFTQEEIIEQAFQDARQAGFPYPKLTLADCMNELNQLAMLEDEKLENSTLGYHIADTFHPHRFEGHAHKMRSPVESYAIDKSLRKAILLAMQEGHAPSNYLHQLNLVNGTQQCSNFRPAYALKMYRQFCTEESVILDTSTGYGGRLLGFMASGAKRYIGIDPNTPTHHANLLMAHELGFGERVELINLPAEDVKPDDLAGRCDFAFTSPPYFKKEQYSEDDTQSWKRYPDGDAWRDGFLAPMLALQYQALKAGSYNVINIEDVNIGKKKFPLVQWTLDIAQELGFLIIQERYFMLPRRFGSTDNERASERVLIFQKPA